MPKRFQPPFPAAAKQMRALGERLELARRRRSIPASHFAERMGVSRTTLHRLESGDARVALGTLVRALRVLGLDGDLDLLARDDELGRKLQDSELIERRSSSESRQSRGTPTR